MKTILFLVVTPRFRLVYGLYKIWQFSSQNQIQNIIFHFYYFGKSFWNVNNKKLSSFAQWTKKLPGIGCHGEERKLSKEICQNLSKMLSRIHRHKYLCYFLFFVFFIELCAWGKLYFGTPGTIAYLSHFKSDKNGVKGKIGLLNKLTKTRCPANY